MNKVIKYLEIASKCIALIVCIGLLFASLFLIVDAFRVLFTHDIDLAIQDGLFVLILLEMFYVILSFVKNGTINVGLIINVGIIATVKELVFQLQNINWQLSAAFGILFIALSFAYLMEVLHFSRKKS